MDYETFEHGADIGIRGYGETIEEAFSNALKALFELLVEEIDWETVEEKKGFPVRAEAEFLDELFVIFINKVLGIFYDEKVILKSFYGKIESFKEGFALEGEVRGEDYLPEKFGYGVEVKGATFTLAKVEQKEGKWIAQCVVDV